MFGSIYSSCTCTHPHPSDLLSLYDIWICVFIACGVKIFFLKKSSLGKVAPRVEKTVVFRKDWNFENWTYFASCVMRKHYFLLCMKKTAFFPYFYHGVIFYSTELFDCAVNFKFYLNIFIFLNINTNQTSKEQYLS